MTSETRAYNAEQVVAFAAENGYVDDNDDLTNTADLICNLLHFADLRAETDDELGIRDRTAASVLYSALNHYLCEVQEDDEGNAPLDPDPNTVELFFSLILDGFGRRLAS